MRWLLHAVITLVTLQWPATGMVPVRPAAMVRPVLPTPAIVAAAAPAPAVAVGGAVARDVTTGQVLFQHGATAVYPLASLTKLMTALVVLDQHPDWSALVTIQASDQRPGGRVVLVPNEQVTVRDLFQVMLVSSSNEAAVALARSTGLPLPAFARAMNVKADALGLESFILVDPAGLEPQNVGNARDVATLLAVALESPELNAALQERSYTFTIHNTGASRRVESTNHLLNAPVTSGLQIVGGKTGYLEEVGYNLVVAVEVEGHRVTLAVLSAASAEERWRETLRLARWVFASYRWPTLGG